MPDAARTLAAAIHRLSKRIGSEVVSAARSGRRVPSFSKHVSLYVEALTPLVLPMAVRGGKQTLGRIRVLLRRRRKALVPIGRKAAADDMGPFGFDLNLFNLKIVDAVRQMVFTFATSTLETSRHETEEAYSLLREELEEGLTKGEAVNRLAKRVGTIFDNPSRAYLVARTEAVRATHAGQLLAAEESGVVKGLRWMASPGACPLCAKLNGVEVFLGQDFAVDPGAGRYGRVPHPPRHPRCTCTTEEVLKDEYA